MSNHTVVPKTEVVLSLKNRQDGTEYLEFVFNNKAYEFDSPAEYVRNEENRDIIALTYAAIIRIANEENITFETLDIIKSSYNHCTVRVVARGADGRVREALIGKNKDNMPSDAKGDADNAAHKKACVEAFLALYGLTSSRFNIKSGKAATKKGSGGINLDVFDDNASDDSNNEVPNVQPQSQTQATASVVEDNASKPAVNPHSTVEMPFGTNKGQTIFSILAGNGGLAYFSRLFAVNQSIKNNKKVSDAIFAYYEEKGTTDEEQQLLSNIRTAIGS